MHRGLNKRIAPCNAASLNLVRAYTEPFRFEIRKTPLSRFSDLAGLDATGADLLAFRPALRTLDANRLQIWIKASARAIVRMRDVITELGRLAADFATLSHDFLKPPKLKKRVSDSLVSV